MNGQTDMEIVAQNERSGQVIRCGISPHFHNKENRAPDTRWCKQHKKHDTCWAFSTSFIPTALSVPDFVQHVTTGGAFTLGYFKSNRRTKANFKFSELLGLDFDGDNFPVSVEQAAADPFIRQYAFLIYPTPSSTPECPSTRVLFRLSEPVREPGRWEALQAGLIARFSHWKADTACKDTARLFYGSDKPGALTLANVLPLDIGYELTYDAATDEFLKFLQPPPERDYSDQSPGDLRAQVIAALSFIPAQSIQYQEQWIPILAALCHTFGAADAESIGESWSGWCSKPGEIGEKIESFTRDTGKKAGVGTIFHLARQYGYTPPVRRYDEPTPERAATISQEPTALPDSWRSALLDYFPASTALLLELIFQAAAAGLINRQDFTAPALQTANESLAFNMPKTTLYRTLEERTGEFVSIFPTTVAVQENIVGNFGNNSKRGRKAARYRLKSAAEMQTVIESYGKPRIYERAHETNDGAILARPTADMMRAAGIEETEAATVASELDTALTPAYQAQGNTEQIALKKAKRRRAKLAHDLTNPHSTRLPQGWTFESAANYRAAFIHATIKADPDTPISRRQLAERAGVDARSVSALRKRAGIQAESQETQVDVQSFDDVRAYGKQHRAYAKMLVAKTADGRIESPAERESYPAFIARQRSAGANVTAHFQHTSTHKIVSEAQPAPAERKPKEPVQGMESRPATRISEPKQERYYGPGYDPRWIMAQLRLALKLLGWIFSDGQYVNPDTGEVAPGAPREIIGQLIGRELDESWDGFLADAAELGAVTSISEARTRTPGPDWQEVPLKRPA